jgi:hypothetical protein
MGLPEDVALDDIELLDKDGEPVAPGDIPPRLAYAQLQQIRNLWNAGNTDGSGDVGTDGFHYTPRPLDKTIKQIIRPLDLTNVF